MATLQTHRETTLRRAAQAIDWFLNQELPSDTCSVSGTGAVAILEHRIAEVHHVRHAIAVSSGTAALLGALHAIGAGPGVVVFVHSSDWPAGSAAARILGCNLVVVDRWEGRIFDLLIEKTASLQSKAVAVLVAAKGAGFEHRMIAQDLSDRGLVVIDDLANCWGERLSGVVGTTSLGSGKAIDAGEGGAILTDCSDLAEVIEQATQHPNRQRLRGIEPSHAPLCMRMHPVAAVTALYELSITHGENRHPGELT